MPLGFPKLAMGHLGSVNRMLSTGHLDRNLALEQNALTKVLFPNEISTEKIRLMSRSED